MLLLYFSIVTLFRLRLIVKWLREATIHFYCFAALIATLLNGCAKRRKTMDYGPLTID